MKLRSIVFSLSIAGVSLAVAACGGTVEHSPQTTANAGTKAPVGANTHGMVKLVGDALGEVSLRPDQRTEIEKLAQDAELRHAPLGESKKDVMLAFADQVEKGAIDKTALQPKIDKATADIEQARAEDRAALVKLHGILDAEQRSAFVDALEKQMKERRGSHGDRAVGFAKGFLSLKQLGDDMKLTDDQKSKIHDVMKEARKDGWSAHHGGRAGHGGPAEGGTTQWQHNRGGHRGHDKGHVGGGEWKKGIHQGKHAMEAFREDKLDLDKVAPPHDIKAMTKRGTDHVAGFAEKVLPILTPEQRKIAADKLRAMAASGDNLLVH